MMAPEGLVVELHRWLCVGQQSLTQPIMENFLILHTIRVNGSLSTIHSKHGQGNHNQILVFVVVREERIFFKKILFIFNWFNWDSIVFCNKFGTVSVITSFFVVYLKMLINLSFYKALMEKLDVIIVLHKVCLLWWDIAPKWKDVVV